MSSIKKHIFFLLLFCLCFAMEGFAQVEEQGATNSLFYYTGTLGASEKIELNLQLNGHAVSGSYILVASGDLFIFKGRLAKDKSGVGILVYDELNNYVASIEARVVSEEIDFARELKGVWKSANGKLKQNMSLKKIAELARVDNEEPSYFD